MQILNRRVSTLAAATLAASFSFAAPASAQFNNIVDTAAMNGNFTTLVDALQATGLDAPLSSPGRFTVFAPTDAAFAALPTDLLQTLQNPANVDLLSSVLLYHVVGDGLLSSDVLAADFFTTLNPQRIDISIDAAGDVFVDNAKIEIVDILCNNGVIHVLDAVLVPNLETVVGTLPTLPDASTLLSVASNFPAIVDVLSGSFPRTIFVPLNSAFAALPPDRLTALVNSPGILNQVLKAHIVPGRLYASDVLAAGSLTTLQGNVLQITTSGGAAFVDGRPIVTVDIEATNGVIHFIDGVLLP